MSLETPFGMVEQEHDFKAWRLIEDYFEPILPIYNDSTVTEIMVNRYDEIYIEKAGKDMERVDASFGSERDLVTAIQQLAKALGQEFDLANPILDARFPDQSRANATLRESCSPDGTSLTIRRAPKVHYNIDQLIGFGALSDDMANYLKHAIIQYANMVVAGGTGSGKTTLIRALTRFIPVMQRVLTAEDTRELLLDWLPNKISMEAPKRRLKAGDQLINLAALIKATLRQRGDRVIVGEIRDGEAADAFLQAVESSQGGCMTTVHANSALRAIRRFQYLLANEGAVSYDLAGHLFLDQIQIVVHAAKRTGIGKKVMEIVEVIDGEPVQVFRFDARAGAHVPTEHLARSAYWPVPPDVLAMTGS